MNQQRQSKKKEISAFLTVIFGGGAFALLVAIGLVYFYGPSGLYDLKYTLLSPKMIDELKYQDVNPQTGSRGNFVFDSINFTYFHPDEGRWKKVAVDRTQYEKFFDSIVGDVSVEEVGPTITDRFLSGYPAILEIIVRPDDKNSNITKTFQEVTLAYQGNYYRVELHEESSQKNWAYFFHKDVYKNALSILK
ncbi:MAG: hypothetical protein AAGG81_04750 [Chlamydiota bacterium]